MKLSPITRSILAARREIRDITKVGYVHVPSGGRLMTPYGSRIISVLAARHASGIFVRFGAR
jgi:hypothetical protein